MRGSSTIGRFVYGMCLVAAAVPVSPAAAPVSPEERTIHGQPSWLLATNDVELAVTKRGGHMAPATFDRKAASPIRPYHISPWQDEGLEKLPAAVLEPLRGDFFCMPFGGNAAPRGSEQHVPHGETATAEWRLGEAGSNPAIPNRPKGQRTKVSREPASLVVAEGRNLAIRHRANLQS